MPGFTVGAVSLRFQGVQGELKGMMLDLGVECDRWLTSVPKNIVRTISCGGYTGAHARQGCLRQWFVTAIEVGDQGFVSGSLAGSAFEEKAGFVRPAQITQEHSVVNLHRRFQAGIELDSRRGGRTDTCCRSPNYAASPGKEFSTSAGASLALSTHRDFGQ